MKKKALLAFCGLLFFFLPVWAQINLLHEFSGGQAHDTGPYGSLLISGSTLYGMTYSEGAYNKGTIFKMETDGTGYTILHSFVGGPADGGNPTGDLIISGATLFGVTSGGGSDNNGTVFRIQTDGSGYTLLHKFAGDPGDGQWPHGHLVLSGSTLYGMTSYGGHSENGTIFMLQTDGSGYTLLHEFGGPYGSWRPYGSLLLNGSTLFGMTAFSGEDINSNKGTIFKIETNGSGFIVLHGFDGGRDNGSYPHGSLILSGTTLFGMTASGGKYDQGTIFMLQIDGTGFKLLHEFAGSNDGARPQGSLILSDSTLYGMTTAGGNGDKGTIFKIQTDGNCFFLRHVFTGGPNDGEEPHGSLIYSGSTLYGMTADGGDMNRGIIFSLPLSTNVITVQAQRREIKAFSILRHYGQIQFTVEDPAIPAAQYRIVRSEDGGDFILIKTVDPTDLQNGRFQMEDKYLEIDKQYSYRVEVYNSAGQIIAISFEKTI